MVANKMLVMLTATIGVNAWEYGQWFGFPSPLKVSIREKRVGRRSFLTFLTFLVLTCGRGEEKGRRRKTESKKIKKKAAFGPKEDDAAQEVVDVLADVLTKTVRKKQKRDGREQRDGELLKWSAGRRKRRTKQSRRAEKEKKRRGRGKSQAKRWVTGKKKEEKEEKKMEEGKKTKRWRKEEEGRKKRRQRGI